MKTATPITSFKGDYYWLSNFYPVFICYEGLTYPSVENAYQAAKTVPALRDVFITCSAGDAKERGRSIPLRIGWASERVITMQFLIGLKFPPGSEIANKLLATHPSTLIEGNTWGDTFWGVCNGQGQNVLGHLLMAQRSLLKVLSKTER